MHRSMNFNCTNRQWFRNWMYIYKTRGTNVQVRWREWQSGEEEICEVVKRRLWIWWSEEGICEGGEGRMGLVNSVKVGEWDWWIQYSKEKNASCSKQAQFVPAQPPPSVSQRTSPVQRHICSSRTLSRWTVCSLRRPCACPPGRDAHRSSSQSGASPSPSVDLLQR